MLLLTSPLVASTQTDLVRKNFLDYYTGAAGDRSAPRMRSSLASLEGAARAASAPDFLRGDGSWSDINYREVPSGSWSPWDHTRRLIVMAKAYRTPGQALYGDPQLRTAIEAALSYIPKYYGVTTIPNGNWWFWTLGVPLDLGPTLVLMRGDVDPRIFDDCVNTLALHIGNGPYSRGLIGPVPVGQNLVWSSFTHLTLALLNDDDVMMGAVRDAMATVALPTALGDGIKPDNSFWQHGPQLYTGGYGGSFANDVARYALLTRGTSFQLPQASFSAFADYVADGVAWALYGNYFDVSVVGREVARVSTSGYNGIASLLQASAFDSPRSSEIHAATARMLQSWTWDLPPELAALAVQAERSSWIPAWPEGHRHYYLSDFSVHRRNGWMASIKMFSKRTKSGESTNNENLLGSRQSDGRFYLVLDGNEYFGRDVFPALDWSRLPGITVEQKPDAASSQYSFGTQAFAGGTGDGSNGVSAMELIPVNSSLNAKKSWFFFDDTIVFLTSGVTSLSPNRIETIVEQWPLMNASSPLTINGATISAASSTLPSARWAFCERIGYYFPQPATLNVQRATRSGSWAALGGSSDNTTRTAPFVTMWLDHGVTPINASAAYAIIPNVTESAMRAWAASNPIRIAANDTKAAAVVDNRTNSMGLVFWSAGAAVEGFQSEAQAIVYATNDGTTLRLSITDPTNGSGSFRLTVPGHYITSDAPFTGDSRATTITVPRGGGQTFTATLTRVGLPTRRRAS